MASATAPSAAELYTVVENTSGATRVFGFLGTHGMRLAAGEVVAIPGDLRAQLAGKRRQFNALQRSIQANSIRINSTPAPIFFDPVAEAPKSLSIVDGALGTVDPTYNSEDSESFAEVGG